MHGKRHVRMGRERHCDMLDPGGKHFEEIEEFRSDLPMGPYERRALPERYVPAHCCRD